MKKILLVAVLALCVFAFCACGDAQTGNNTTTASDNTTPATRIVKDFAGTEVEIPYEVKRVVNTWPSSNSVLLLSGAGDKMVAIPSATANNAWAQYLFPFVKDLPNEVNNAEEVMKLEPDIYFLNNEANTETARKAGINSAYIWYSDYDDMKTTFKILGEFLGGKPQENLNKWCDEVDYWIDFITKRLGDVKEEDKPLLYYIGAMSNGDLTQTMAAGGIQNTWCNILGCTYLGEKLADGAATSVNIEEVLKLNPDIIVLNGLKQDEAWKNLQESELFADTNAMKNGKAYLAPVGVFPWTRFGFESVVLLPWLAVTLYPDLFTDIDIYEVTRDFYSYYAGVELTDDDITNIFRGAAPGTPVEK